MLDAQWQADLDSVSALPNGWRWKPSIDLYALLETLDTSTRAYVEVSRELDLRETFAGVRPVTPSTLSDLAGQAS